MAEATKLVEKRAELAAKTKRFQDIVDASTDQAGKTDLSKAAVLEKLGATDVTDAKGKLDALYHEVVDLQHDVDELHLAEMKSGVSGIAKDLQRPIRDRIPTSNVSDEPLTFGRRIAESKAFKLGQERGWPAKFDIEMDLKTLMQTSAGWQPRTANGTVTIDKVIRPVQVLDFIPSDRTDLFEYPFMEETTRTQAAVETAEAGTYQEDAFAFTRRTSPIRKIGSQIPVTDEQLADVSSLPALLDNRLRFGVLARLDQQALVGDGTGSNLTGIANASGVQTQAKGADPAVAAIFKALTLVRITGRAMPNLIVMHGTDWQNIRLSQNAQGDFQFGPPSTTGADTLWGLPVVQSEALTQGTALVGAFSTYAQILYRNELSVEVGYISTQFIEGKKTLRADVRAGVVTYRGAAFCKVTGL